jgi:hypothetical protein
VSTILKAFRHQNQSLLEHLSKGERRSLYPHVEHHSGGLIVAGRPFYYQRDGVEYDTYCKVHDTWGDPDDPEEGPIVVHLYDTNEELIPGKWSGSDVVLYFTSGVDAVSLFLNEEALAGIWRVTR